jgi:hypothetical protein
LKLSKIIILLLIPHFAICSCDGFNWFGGLNMDDCHESDIIAINALIFQSKETIEWDMDTNFDGEIEPLEVGWQFWEDGRLVHWICSDVPSPWYIYNYNCGLSGEIPPILTKLDKLEKLHFDNNDFSGGIVTKICDLKVAQKSDYWFRISDNRLCPPFPVCVVGKNLIQDSSDCYE